MDNEVTTFKAPQLILWSSRSDEPAKNAQVVSAHCTKVQTLEGTEAETEASAMLKVDGRTARSNGRVKNARQTEQQPEALLLLSPATFANDL